MRTHSSIEHTLAILTLTAIITVAGRGVSSAAQAQSDAVARARPAVLDPPMPAAEPRVDTIDIHGAGRTRASVVARVSGLHVRQVMSPAAFAHAIRRVHDLPVAAESRLTAEPDAGGQTKVDVFITERRVAPNRWSAFGVMGARAAILREVKVNIAGATGAGELVSASWQWKTNRPKATLGLALPSPKFLPGILSFDSVWERQSYDLTPTSTEETRVREERRRAGLHLSDWSASWIHWQTGVAYDRLREYDAIDPQRFPARGYATVDSTIDLRGFADRVAVVTSGGWWAPVAGGGQFGTAGLLTAWRSTADLTRAVWSGVAEVTVASRMAPLALWSGAGTGSGRVGLLRAHPLLESGVVDGAVFGRRAAHATAEYARPVARLRASVISVAGFVDAAQAWRRVSGLSTSPIYVDAGVGVRARAPGPGGAIRFDVAHGLRGGGTMFSAGWGVAWPR